MRKFLLLINFFVLLSGLEIPLHRNGWREVLQTTGRAVTSRPFTIRFEFLDAHFMPDVYSLIDSRNFSSTLKLFFTSPIDDDENSILIPRSFISLSWHSFNMNYWTFGINPRSLFVRHFGPIALFSNSTDNSDDEKILQTNSSYDLFQSKCVSNSAIELWGNSHHSSYGATMASFHSMNIKTRPNDLNIKTFEGGLLMVVPLAIFETIREAMLSLGVSEIFRHSGRMIGCSESIIEKLPNITLSFIHPLSNGTSGQLIISPNDYILLERDTCHLRLRTIAPGAPEIAAIDLTKLSGLNLFITDQGVSICDAL